MSKDPETLEAMIEMLREFPPSVLLVRCLVLAGRREEAREVSKHVAGVETSRLAASSNLPVTQTAELRLRAIFTELIAGRTRNARVLLNGFIREAERLKTSRPAQLREISGPLAIAAILVHDPDSSAGVLAILSDIDMLPVRVLQAQHDHASGLLRQYVEELRDYIRTSAIPTWSDTWHHILAMAISEEPTV